MVGYLIMSNIDIVEGSAISDELEILSLLIKEYEQVHYPVSYPNPIEAIKFRMEQMNLSIAAKTYRKKW